MKIGWLARIGLNLKRRKELAEEGFDLSQFVNQHSIEIINEPFPHVVIDNFFKMIFLRNCENTIKNVCILGYLNHLKSTEVVLRQMFFLLVQMPIECLMYFFHLHGTIILQKFLNSLPIR